MDGENNGKPYFLMDVFGGKTHHLRKHPYDFANPKSDWLFFTSTPRRRPTSPGGFSEEAAPESLLGRRCWFCRVLLLMEEILHHLGCIKPS